MSGRFTWSWNDFYRRFPDRRPRAASAEIIPFPAPVDPLPPAPCACSPVAAESARLRRARELLAMGVEGAMVLRCVSLTAAERLALWGRDEPDL